MEGEEIETSWKSKYRSLKNKYSELRNIRIESVKTDTEDLKQKIEEHRQIHDISTKELKQQNSDLRKSIKDIEDAKNDVQRLKEKINTMRQKLRNYDPILREFMNYDKFFIKCIGHHIYQISYNFYINQNRQDSIVFTLECLDNKFRYIPEHCPDGLKQSSEFLYQSIEFTNVRNFIEAILQINEK